MDYEDSVSEYCSFSNDELNNKLFIYETDLNEYIYYHTHRINQKNYFRYYIDKKLYKLFSYCFIYPNNFEVEFFTLSDDYEKIWEKMSNGDYGYTNLVDCEYDENYHCYTVSVVCGDLLNYMERMYNFASPLSEKTWKEKAENCNWNNAEIYYGYMNYKQRCREWNLLHLY